MAYTDLQENTKIRASVLNANFDALRGELQEIGAGIQTDVSTQMASTTSTMSTQITQMTDAINNCVKRSGAETISGNKTFTNVTFVKATTTAGSALCNSASSYSSPGYIKFGNGVMIQWGKYKNTSQTQAHTLPQAFKNTSYIVTRAHQGTSYEQKWAGGGVSVSTESKINITVGNDVGSGLNTFIIAIGRWN